MCCMFLTFPKEHVSPCEVVKHLLRGRSSGRDISAVTPSHPGFIPYILWQKSKKH